MTTAPVKQSAQEPGAARPREWTPRIWEGCSFHGWARLLWRNRFAVHWSCFYIAAIVTFVSLFHSVLRLVQDAVYGSRVRRQRLSEAPIFIIGHWRTGTTLLHELLIQDERHSFPTTYECLEPNHFLLTENVITRWLGWMMSSRRPMDNMATGWDRPQEDEFALCMLGERSPYLTIAFPNHPPQDTEYLDLERLPARARQAWKRGFYRFVQHVAFRNPRRLVLKSPTHTCRIKVLLELFPEARFVHIVRDPYVVFPSTVNLWKTLYRCHGLQPPTFEGLDESVLNTFCHVYDKLDEGRKLVDPSRFHELRYEELVRDPVGQMRELYEHLGLGEFEDALPRLRKYLADNAGYQTNRYEQLSPELRAEITRRWAKVIRQYGYGEPTVEKTVPAPIKAPVLAPSTPAPALAVPLPVSSSAWPGQTSNA